MDQKKQKVRIIIFLSAIGLCIQFLVFYFHMSASQVRECSRDDASIKVDYDTSDPVMRWDSYENFNLHHQDSVESKKQRDVK